MKLMTLPTKRNDPEVNKKLISILDTLIQEGHWDKSLFLQATVKEIRGLREELATKLDLGIDPQQASNLQQTTSVNDIKLTPEQQEVYVALYQANGTNIPSWEQSLELLLSRSSSRPIYDTEAKAKDMMVRKGDNPNNAYAVIIIDKSDIIPIPEKHVTDKYGHELLTLREEALKVKNIRRFVHISGTYSLEKGHLIKQK